MTDVTLRQAVAKDLDALVQLEQRCFSEDRISRRSFKRFLEQPRDRLIVAQQASELVGYCLVLMNAATRLARIYSIAVSPSARGRGVGEKLVREAEKEAVDADRILMRLEVREDRSEEHTSELQSRPQLVCRLLLEKKNISFAFPLGGTTSFAWQSSLRW